jgi:AcrR family transcriptional regulator
VSDLPSRQLRWIRPPRQARTQETLDRLLDSAERMLEDKGFDDLSVAEIARHAGSSVGAFYRRLKDKDAVLHALHERYCDEAYATADAALDRQRWEGAGIADITEAVVPFLVEIYSERVGLERAIYRRSLVDPVFRERSLRLSSYVMRGWTDLLLERRDEIGHPEPEIGVPFAIENVFAVISQRFAGYGPEAEIVPLSNERLVRELVRSFLAHLGVR